MSKWVLWCQKGDGKLSVLHVSGHTCYLWEKDMSLTPAKLQEQKTEPSAGRLETAKEGHRKGTQPHLWSTPSIRFKVETWFWDLFVLFHFAFHKCTGLFSSRQIPKLLLRRMRAEALVEGKWMVTSTNISSFTPSAGRSAYTNHTEAVPGRGCPEFSR